MNHRAAPVMSRSTNSNELGGAIAREGFLVKQGGARGGFKSWRRRWFAIKRGCLFYYKTRATSDDDQALLGVLPLSGARVVDLPDEHADQRTTAVCFECKRAFTMMTKRQKCSICSRCFCKVCLASRVTVPSMGFDKPVRACSRCYSQVVHDHRHRSQDGLPVKALKARIHSDAGDRPNVFLIQTPDRELLVQAESEDDKKAWIDALLDTIVKREAWETEASTKAAPSNERWEIDYSQLTFMSKVGTGAFGDVYKGRLWGSDVAIKKLKDPEVNDKILDDLKKEVAILSQLRHPNVVLYIGACTVVPNICIVTEWCDRGSLFDILYKQKMVIDTRRAIDIAIGLAQGMSYLHSLDANIIHRDLKSHNVLLDQSFTVKIADFGLSHMRELSSAMDKNGSAAGQYGIFGTPEWMAPEVMEGSPYTNKIDVYSFGVVLTEIFNRQIPLRDQYKIHTYVDVFEAVLEDGARPTIPEWVGSAMQSLVVECLGVVPSSRPTFMEVIARLTQALHLPTKAIVSLFDVKRLLFLLDNPRLSMQELGAREIAQMKPSSDPCHHCGQSLISVGMFDHDTIMLFVEKLAILLNASGTTIAKQCCAALVALLSSAGGDKNQSTYSEIVLKEVGLGRLMDLCNGPDEELLAPAVSLVKQITPDLIRPDGGAIRELDQRTAASLHILVQGEIQQLTDKLDDVKNLVQSKIDLINNLKQSTFTIEKPLMIHRHTPSWRLLDKGAAPIEEVVVDGVVINKVFPVSDISTLPTTRELSESFFTSFRLSQSGLLHTDYALLLDPDQDRWRICLILMYPRELHIFDRNAGQSAADTCLAMVRVTDKAPTQIIIGRKGAKPHCIHICEEQDSLVICPRSLTIAHHWAHILCPDRFAPVHQLNVATQLSRRQLLDVLSEVVLESRVLSTNSSGWVLALDPTTEVWYPGYAHFVQAKPNVMTLYETANLSNVILSIKIQSVTYTYDSESPRAARGTDATTLSCSSDSANSSRETEEWSSRVFEVAGLLVRNLDYKNEEAVSDQVQSMQFCAVSIGERHNWVEYCRRVTNTISEPDRCILERDDDSSENGLSTLPQDIKDQLRKTIYPIPTSAVEVTPVAKMGSSVSLSSSAAGLDQVAAGVQLLALSDFAKQFGPAYMHGYLFKRGGFRKNWKMRYFYLVGNQLRYFPSHKSSPGECLGIIYTATGSGKRFSVYGDPTTKPFGFCIDNPSRIWYLEAQSDADLHNWIRGIQEAAVTTASMSTTTTTSIHHHHHATALQ